MGMFDFFKRRRDRESAVHLPDTTTPADQPVVGSQVPGGGTVQGLDLAEIGTAIQKAFADGNVTIEQGPTQTLDLRGTGLREEILGIMKEHGIDPEAGTAGQDINAGDYGNMQQQILAALAKHGVDPNAAGSSVNLQVEPPKDE